MKSLLGAFARDIGEYISGLRAEDRLIIQWHSIDRQLVHASPAYYYAVIALEHGQRHKFRNYFSTETVLHTTKVVSTEADGAEKVDFKFEITGDEIRRVIESERADRGILGYRINLAVYRDSSLLGPDEYVGGTTMSFDDIRQNKGKNIKVGGLYDTGAAAFSMELAR